MAGISQITPSALRLHSGARLLKSADYERALEGSAILSRAKETAARIEKEALLARERAIKEGYEEGRARARFENMERHFVFVENACAHMRGVEETLGAMVAGALRKIVGRMDPALLTEKIIQKALRQYRTLPSLTLRVPPDQEEPLRKRLDDISRAASLNAPLRIEADGRLRAGDCFLESPLGVVDVGLETQIAFLEEAIGEKSGWALSAASAKKEAGREEEIGDAPSV